MRTQSNLKMIADLAASVGYDVAAERLGMKKESVRRRVREFKQSLGACAAPIGSKIIAEGSFKPRILLYDIETSPSLAWVWKCYKENISPSQMNEHGEILCWAAKWLGENEIICDSKEHDEDDSRICSTIWDMFDEADVVVGHNGIAFDAKTLRTRWLEIGMQPPSPFREVDTYRIAKDNFRFEQNSLAYIAWYLGIGSKLKHEGFELWKKCMSGDPNAWKTMRKYNMHDVDLLEGVYLRFRAWDKRAPNIGLVYTDDAIRCGCCGSSRLNKLDKPTRTNMSEFNSYRCMNCGTIKRGNKPLRREGDVLRNSL